MFSVESLRLRKAYCEKGLERQGSDIRSLLPLQQVSFHTYLVYRDFTCVKVTPSILREGSYCYSFLVTMVQYHYYANGLFSCRRLLLFIIIIVYSYLTIVQYHQFFILIIYIYIYIYIHYIYVYMYIYIYRKSQQDVLLQLSLASHEDWLLSRADTN